MTGSWKAAEGAVAARRCPVDGMALPETDLLQSVWSDVAPQLARLIGALGGGHAQRDDLLQDVYLAAWRKRPAGVDAVQLRRWLIRVTVNRCRLEQRQRRRWREKWFALTRRWPGGSLDGDADRAAESSEDRQMVQAALAQLDPDLRDLLVLRYFLEYDSTEIGHILGRPAATIRGQLRQARRQLADKLVRAGYEHE